MLYGRQFNIQSLVSLVCYKFEHDHLKISGTATIIDHKYTYMTKKANNIQV